ncbi:MAG TPA: stress response translation initiation inhibitor YciH [Thermoplasmata archaeon]|nr:stress response translation initiation inhibitor YciH [Thermoplasmata archaeon]
MAEVCTTCGLPKDICQCEEMSKGQQSLRIVLDKRRYGKDVTIVEGVGSETVKDVCKTLKNRCACGGTVKDGKIELQGDHKKKVTEVLMEMGFQVEK